jgi:hypothetical protein
MKTTLFWDVAPCSLADRCFTYVYLLTTAIIVLMMEAVNTSETSVSIYQTTQRNIPETFVFNIDIFTAVSI